MDKIDYKRSLNFAKFQVIKKALDIISGNDFTPHLEILFFTYFNGVIVSDPKKVIPYSSTYYITTSIL
ncbi:MAG: hypothetical protein LBU56_03980 [Rickettsiales bacterium]|jgi:hypothetical protein|nr:hypothetical protein [Rickettsiales bacterium]